MVDISDLLGVRYREHGRSTNGFDCYGFAIEVGKRFGYELPDFDYIRHSDPLFEDKSSRLLKEGFGKRIPVPVEGAILLFQNMCGMKNHIGIYIGDGMFAHCGKEGSRMERLCDWQDKLGGIYLWQKL